MPIRPVQNNGELNGEVGIYRAKFKVNNNRIFAVRDLTISDLANTGMNPVNEYQLGEEHIGRIFVDNENEVTLTVQNPGGTLNLMVNYTLISERPIEPQDVVTEDANYQVAQDYLERKEDAVEVVVITEDDDNTESSWLQKRHVDKHISDFMPVIDPVDNVLHSNERNTAGNSRAKFEKKKGESPSSSVLDMVHMIYIKMKIEEISADKTYIIVHLGAKNFIPTLSDSETVSHLKNRIRGIDGVEIANLDEVVVKNLATGQLLKDSMLCKEIQNGQKKTNHFVAPQTNIKWVSIEARA